MKSLAQLKIDAKNNGWPWPIDHPNDERALLDGHYVDFRAALRVKGFYEELLCIPRSATPGEEEDGGGRGVRPFVLLDWWFRLVLGPLFGWKRRDGRRRFDKGFVTTAKKSAKSTVLSGLPLYMILADGEEEAEAYSAATDRDQASIIYKKCSRMGKKSPELAGILNFVDSQKRITHPDSGGVFEAISADADSAEGKNPHLLIADELHVWRDRQFFNSLMYGDIARAQPLFLMITTAGEDAECVGFEEYQFAKDLLDPNNEFYSPSHFAFIAEAAPHREWDDPEGWKEANPSLGEIGSIEKLQSKCDEARQSPRKQREFIRYICNRWVAGVEDPWLGRDEWAACGAKLPDHVGDEAWGGLDLSKTTDLSSLALAFECGEFIDLLWWFWMPEDRVKELEDRDRAPYRLWVKQGFIEATPGPVIDYACIRRTITGQTLDERGLPNDELFDDRLNARYDIKQIGFDPYNASKLVTELGQYDGIEMIEFRQGFMTMNTPSKEFERRIRAGKIRHGNNPVANWMAGHCIVDSDPAGNIKPSKKKSTQKIDGIVAAIMGLGLAMKGEAITWFNETNALEIG